MIDIFLTKFYKAIITKFINTSLAIFKGSIVEYQTMAEAADEHTVEVE